MNDLVERAAPSQDDRAHRPYLVTGGAMSLIVDEALTRAFGYSAPSRDDPTATHIRGFIAQLLFGLTIAAAAETLYRLAPATLKSDRKERMI